MAATGAELGHVIRRGSCEDWKMAVTGAAQRGGMYWRIPVTRHFFIEPQQGNRAARHFERGDVAADQRACDVDIDAAQDFSEFVGNDIQFDERSATHSVDEG